MAANMLPILALGAVALLMMKKKGTPSTNGANGANGANGNGNGNGEGASNGGTNGTSTGNGASTGNGNGNDAPPSPDVDLPNFYDFSNLDNVDIESLEFHAMGELLLAQIVERGGPTFALGIVRGQPEKLAYVRDWLRWGASQRSDMSFIMIDCAFGGSYFGCGDPWRWGYSGEPVFHTESPPPYTGFVNDSFGQVIKDFVENM